MEQQTDELAEAKEWYREALANKVIKSLEKNNIIGLYVKTKEEALNKVISMIPEGSTVGYGGSISLDQIGVKDVLRAGNYNFIDRNKPGLSADEIKQMQKDALLADYFLMSTNALTMDGELVNVDGNGNRIAAMIFGPEKVIIVAGINKIVDDLDAAMIRIKDYATPILSRRRGRAVPCAQTGVCVDCRAPQRSCNTICIIENQRRKDRMTIIIVGEELGV